MLRTASLTVAALALVVGLAACGSSSSGGEKKSTTTAASGSDEGASTTKADGGDDDGGDDASTTVVATGGGEFCDDLASFMNDTSMNDIDVSDPEAYKEAIKDSVDKGKQLLKSAPDELDDSVEVLLDAQDELIAELEKVDYDFTKVSPDAFSVMDTPEVKEAGEKLDAYITDTCGIDIPQVTAATIPDMTVPDMTTPSN